MPATINNFTIAATLTQASIYAGIKSVFSSLGYTAYAEYISSGTLFVVYQKVFNSKTFGNIFLRIGVTTGLAISQTIGTAVDTATNTVANASPTIISNAFTAATPIDIRSFKSQASEYDLIHIRQGGSPYIILGWLKPSVLNNIDENSYTAALMFASVSNSVSLLGTALNPYSNANYSAYSNGYLTYANHYGLRDLFPNMPILTSTGRGIFGLTSDDFAIGAGSGLGTLESVGGRQCIINRGNSDSSIFLG